MFSTQTLYENIEAERGRRGWTMQEVSDKLGINLATYRQRLATARDVPASVVVQYAELFDVSADYLLGLSDKIKRQ